MPTSISVLRVVAGIIVISGLLVTIFLEQLDSGLGTAFAFGTLFSTAVSAALLYALAALVERAHWTHEQAVQNGEAIQQMLTELQHIR